jgi:hypothetical protein
MKYIFTLLTLTLALSSCIAQKEISTTACQDPKYLHLLTVPIDSMNARDFAYFQTKDRECEEATAAANAVEQQEVSENHTMILTWLIALPISIVCLVFANIVIHR